MHEEEAQSGLGGQRHRLDRQIARVQVQHIVWVCTTIQEVKRRCRGHRKKRVGEAGVDCKSMTSLTHTSHKVVHLNADVWSLGEHLPKAMDVMLIRELSWWLLVKVWCKERHLWCKEGQFPKFALALQWMTTICQLHLWSCDSERRPISHNGLKQAGQCS